MKTKKNKVERLFIRFPETVQSSTLLLDRWRHWFQETVENQEGSIKRCRRKLIQLCRENKCNHSDPQLCYKLDQATQLITDIQEESQRLYWGTSQGGGSNGNRLHSGKLPNKNNSGVPESPTTLLYFMEVR